MSLILPFEIDGQMPPALDGRAPEGYVVLVFVTKVLIVRSVDCLAPGTDVVNEMIYKLPASTPFCPRLPELPFSKGEDGFVILSPGLKGNPQLLNLSHQHRVCLRA